MSGGGAQFKHLKSIAGRHLVYEAASAGAYRPERDGLASAHLFEHIERLESYSGVPDSNASSHALLLLSQTSSKSSTGTMR